MHLTSCTLGLGSDFTARRELVARSERIYFSDLTGADLSRLDLSARHFFGCILTGCDFRGATLDGCRFENCFVADEEPRSPLLDKTWLTGVSIENCNFTLPSKATRLLPQWDLCEPGAAEAIRCALQGDYEPAFGEIHMRLSPPGPPEAPLRTPTASAMLALCATGLRHPDWERRLSALSLVSRALFLDPEAFGAMHDAYLAVLLYRTGDSADTVYFPALDLVKTFEPDELLLRHVLSRIESIEPAERLEALRGGQRLLTQYDCGSLFPLEGLEKLLKDPHQPPAVLRKALQFVNDAHEPLSFAVGEDVLHERLTPTLPHLLKHGDVQVRKEALRAVIALRDRNSGAQVRDLLHDVSPDIRGRAFMVLYDTLPEDEVLQFLKDFPPDPVRHAQIVSHQVFLRGKGWSNSLISDEELRPLLTSEDPKARLDGLYYASFLGDPQYLPELLENLRHGNPAIRTAALRAIEYLSPPPEAAELRFLEHDPSEEVRTQLEKTLNAIAEKLH